jgi:formate hydrogenlyase subunit 3/multisubunit Na+/H+ antiporter MnhD subunit
MAILIEYPLLAGAIGLLLVGLGRWAGRRIGVAVGLIWLLYAAYETGMQQRWLCRGECNIRIDLLLLYPLLLVASVVAGVSLLRASRARRVRS